MPYVIHTYVSYVANENQAGPGESVAQCLEGVWAMENRGPSGPQFFQAAHLVTLNESGLNEHVEACLAKEKTVRGQLTVLVSMLEETILAWGGLLCFGEGHELAKALEHASMSLSLSNTFEFQHFRFH